MVQTVMSETLPAGGKKRLVKKPLALSRIFFSVRVFAPSTEWHEVKISFDEPQFFSFYVLDESARYFEAIGDDIFQGDIWVYNISNINLLHSATEILH